MTFPRPPDRRMTGFALNAFSNDETHGGSQLFLLLSGRMSITTSSMRPSVSLKAASVKVVW